MDTRQMRYFVALAETLHFGRAAERMHMTQPPFSRQIANLERELGVRLVDRDSRHVRLTQAGERFLEDSRAVLARFESACRDARLVAEGQKGELRLGFMMHAAHRIVPRIVSSYSRLRPDVRVVLSETTPADIERRLLHGELDAAVTFAGRPFPQLQAVPILTDRLCLIAPPEHPLAARDRISPGDLEGEDLIAAPAAVAAILRAAITRYLEAGGVVPRFRFEPQLQQTILRLVAAGLGVALVPGSICDDGMPDLVSRPLASAPSLEVVLAVPHGSINPAVAPLVDLVRREGAAPR
ncbi:DNA-binding transcriptional regulator, LysR family [Tistlia consotensis]|uniref:DNA-binding transcriptional regulator, LysR family n=1 Tax=Tistlia consotensis USBA 355 TaxID=560819 RepID=A0A1Y6CEL3_9PROT|nr:LysR substrate-binding domain-containing protein [Tistlia consotensis]SMF58762.1 DNA-binding transcriptional regulator, LysR family [Tistlia consotensis USBA 355]SNR63885.1 DNA-binding transcriptional regulator, LysR family [Tistlia consotensis]